MSEKLVEEIFVISNQFSDFPFISIVVPVLQ